jgi:transposase
MSYRYYPPAGPLLIGYDPDRDLPADHLARLVEQVVEATITPPPRPAGQGQPPFDPRLPVKVLLYGYATGQRSSRQLERLCDESLPYLFLTRGDTPCYRVLCSVRVEQGDLIEQAWLGLFAVAQDVGMQRLGHLVVDSTKLRADASPEAVLTAAEYEPVLQELQRILEEARQVDTQEAAEGRPGTTRLGQTVPAEQMREILRRVRKQLAAAKRAAKEPPKPAAEGVPFAADPPSNPAAAPSPAVPAAPQPLGARMVPRLEAGMAAIRTARAEGRKHLCLTDPTARMMAGGRARQVRECHSFEVAVDREAGLLVVGQTTQEGHDNARLEGLVRAAKAQEPDGVKAVDGDRGYYAGDALGRLLAQGIDPCVPDSNTAGDLHRGQPSGTTRDRQRGQVPFTYDAATDVYHCPEGNELRPTQRREHGGQQVMVYRAREECRACPQAGACLTQANAGHRTLKVGEYQAALEEARQRFAEPEHQERYRHRGEVVETVFGFVRGTLGYTRWRLRGSERVACEGRLIKMAYQLRKVHGRWATA